MGFYEYEVEYWDECEMEMKTGKGVTFAETYKEAMSNIGSYYGDKNIDAMKICGLEESSVYDFNNSPDLHKEVFNHD